MANNAPPPRVTLLMTRPRAAAERFVGNMPAELRARVGPLFSPVMRIEGLSGTVALTKSEIPIFTSSNAVSHGPESDGRPAYCVGVATTKWANQHGWGARMAGEDADGLVSYLEKLPPDQPFVHVRGRHTRGNIVARLQVSGHSAREAIVYEQVLQPLSDAAKNAISREQMVVAPLFSPRMAAQFANQAPRATSLRVVAMSAAVANAAQPFTAAAIAARPDAPAMYDAIADVISAG